MSPFYDFTDGEQLTASLVETYLSRQAVMPFASSATRSAALAPILTEGMVTYLEDTDKLYYYSGSAWVEITTWQDQKDILASNTSISSTTPQDLLTVSLPASSTYSIEAAVYVASMIDGTDTTYGMTITWGTPSSPSASEWFMENDQGTSGVETIFRTGLQDLSSGFAHSGNVLNSGTTYLARGFITTTSAGSLVLKIAKSSSSATGSAQAGSYLIARQVA